MGPGKLLLLALACCALAETPPPVETPAVTIRGKLIQAPGEQPAIETPDRKLISLRGDESTTKVLNDQRLAGFDLAAKGHFVAPGKFEVNPIHTRAMVVHKAGHVKMITYWCDTCAIRTYAPGLCWCCQQETTLDLRDPDQEQP